MASMPGILLVYRDVLEQHIKATPMFPLRFFASFQVNTQYSACLKLSPNINHHLYQVRIGEIRLLLSLYLTERLWVTC